MFGNVLGTGSYSASVPLTQTCFFIHVDIQTHIKVGTFVHLNFPDWTIKKSPLKVDEKHVSFACVNGVIDHSGKCNISITQMKVLVKVCFVRAEMHLDYFISQHLL